VNSNPSFNRDSVVDAVINEQVMESVLKIVQALDPRQQPVEKVRISSVAFVAR
jgi:hypothetical protein